MRESLPTTLPAAFETDAVLPLQPQAPPWVEQALGNARIEELTDELAVRRYEHLALLTAEVPFADALDAGDLRAAVHRVYDALGAALRTLGHTAIRLWNYMPAPGDPMGHGLDRYMVFNEGRSAGYASWNGSQAPAGTSPATASGVGIDGNALVLHCLSSVEGGRSVENPRQISAWRYSRRYGPAPPRFSRATIAVIDGRPRLLIGGTASIVGEDSTHLGDIEGQTTETLKNLSALIGAARGEHGSRHALAHLRDLRVYLTRAQDAGFIRETLEARCPRLERLELAVSQLCRPELLVEIEGVADLTRPA